jgi:hypothetical protein
MPEERIIYVHRDSHGRWWMEERDVKKLAPNLKVDSTISVKLTIGESRDA